MELSTLYKKTSTGKIQEWKIVVEADRFHTISGQVDGKKIISEPTICEAKNVGRANTTSAPEQAAKEAVAKWEKQKKKGYVESIEKAHLGGVNQDFVTGGYNPMLAQRFDKHSSKIEFPAFSQPKLDGIRGCMMEGQMFSRTRKPINAVPHILEALDKIGALGIPLDGELYNHQFKDEFEKISSAVRKEKEPSEWRSHIQYHIYDYNSSDTYKQRLDFLMGLREKAFSLGLQDILQFVPSHLVDSHQRIMEYHDLYTKDGFEGAIVRNAHQPYEEKRSYGLQKVKVFKDEEFKVIGVEEGRGKFKGLASAFICEMEDERGKRTFRVTPKGDLDYKKKLLQTPSMWENKLLTVEFLNYTVKNHVPRHGIGIRFRDPNY